MLIYKKICLKFGREKSNYINSIVINSGYFILVLPAIYFAKDPVMFQTLKLDCVTFLYETLEKFDPARGSKAFSYFNVCAKNFLNYLFSSLSLFGAIESTIFFDLRFESFLRVLRLLFV